MFPVVAATFVVCMASVLGVYWTFIVRPEERAARTLRKRLRPEVAEVPTAGAEGGLARRPPPLSALKGLDKLLGRSGRMLDPLRNTLELSGLSTTIGAIVLGSLFAALVVLVLVKVTTSLTWLAIVLGIAAAFAPYLAVRYAASRRLQQFEDQFPQAIDLIASSLRAGHAFITGVSMVSDEVADPTGAEFRLLYDHQNYGMPLPDALKSFAKRVPLLDARFFITAVLTQREAGGNLAEVLDNLSGLIRERSRVKRQVRVASAHGRVTGWILSLMPPALALIMVIIAPAHMKNFIDDPIGVRMIILALVLQVAGTLAIRRIVNVEF
jgi:tight adherence protein B